MKRLHVLISAHEFSPYQGSECAVGWNIATRMAAFHDVTVLCADGAPGYPSSYRNAVEDYFAKHGAIPGLRVVYVNHPPQTLRLARLNRQFMKLTKGVGWQVLFYMGLDAWHREAFRLAEGLGFNNFDVIHHLTPISFRMPGYFWKINKPFFWGPVGGLYKVPLAFARWSGLKTYFFEIIRSANIELKIHKSSLAEAIRAASRVWVITGVEQRIVNSIGGDKALPMIEAATPAGITGRLHRFDKSRPLLLCWSGTHEAIKALSLLLEALAQLPEPECVHLTVLGEGPETQKWKALAKKLALKNVTWCGRLAYQQALLVMGNADMFVHTSYREGTPHVVLEALGWGMPVICHDACGMAVAINEDCGLKVPLENPERSIAGFRDAIHGILQNHERVQQLSEGALRRAAELSWDSKVKEIATAYEQSIG